MAAPSLTYTLTNGQTADASHVMQNFNDLLDGITDGTKDLAISALTVGGVGTFNGNNILGSSSSDDLTVNASLASHLVPKTTSTYDLGAASIGYAGLYLAASGEADTARVVAAAHAADLTYTIPDLGTAGTFAFLEATQTFTGIKNNTAMPAFRVDRNGAANISFASGDLVLITGWSEASALSFDQAGNFASDKFTVPTGGGGIYHFGLNCYCSGAAMATDSISAKIYKNGAIAAHSIRYVTTASDNVVAVAVNLTLAATDYIEFVVSTSSGTNISLESTAHLTYAYGHKLY